MSKDQKTPTEKCTVCQKTVFAMEKVSLEGKIFHEGCFKCAHCKKKLSPGTYTVLENTYYCHPHYTQLFTTKGNYSDGFGKERPTSGWAPSTASYEGTDTKKPTTTTQPTTTSTPHPPGPPGPPPPAPPPLTEVPTAGVDGGNAHAAALAAIASGGHKLKHVSKEERKKPPVSSVVPGDAKPKAKAPTGTGDITGPKKGTPEKKQDGLKWIIRYYENEKQPMLIVIPDMKQSVTITDCIKTVFQIKGKITNLSVMNCNDCAIVFDDVIAAVELVRCKKIQIQGNGKVAQIIVDKVNGCDIFIQSEEGLGVEIVSSLADGVNINYPGATPEDDMLEFPVPNQFESVMKGGKLVTTAVVHV